MDAEDDQPGNATTPAGEDDGHSPGWYPDPLGRSEQRFYDGNEWTSHIVVNGAQEVDPLGTDAVSSASDVMKSATAGMTDHIVSGKNAAKFTGAAARWQGTGHLFTEPVLVVEQHAKLLDTSNSYDISHPEGHTLGSVRQVGQSQTKQLISAFSNFDKHMTHTFEVLDTEGGLMLRVTRPAKMMKSKIIVEGGDGVEVGRIVQKKTVGKIRFALEAGGRDIGTIQGKNWRDKKFTILDENGEEIGRISKSFEGLSKALLGADHYVVEMHRPLEDPLRQLVVAAAVSVDTALHHED